MYVDSDDHLWVLDAGNPGIGGRVVTAGPKLFKIDLEDDTIAQVFFFDHKRDFTRNSYLSDFRVDTERQTAYITESARGTIYVVELKTRRTHHVLLGDPTTTADSGFVATVGSHEWRTFAGSIPQVNVSGIELSSNGDWLYYHTMSGRRIFRVPTQVLRDTRVSDATRSAAIEDLGPTGSVIDGMWLDAEDNLYLAAIERDAIIVRRPSGSIETFVADPRLKWPDSLAMGPNGYLYFTTSMRHLREPYRITDQTDEPYFVMKASPDKVAHANVTRQIAKDKLEEAAWYADQSEAAKRLAQEAAKQAEAERRAALARADLARLAQRDAELSATRHGESVRNLEVAAGEQAKAARQAATLAALAKEQALDARDAAEEAREAAAIARRLAKVAKKKVEQTRQAQADAELGAEQAKERKAEHEQAMAQAKLAAQAAADAEEAAGTFAREASEAAELANRAEALARRELEAAEQLTQRATEARTAAALAERLATDAEYAEINGTNSPVTGTADVPTTTD